MSSAGQLLRLLAALALLASVVVMVLPVIELRRVKQTRIHHDQILNPLGEDGQSVAQQAGGGAQILFVDSTPSGAEVLVDGIDSGTTPLSTELHCPSGSEAEVVVKRSGWKTFKAKVKCAEGTITKLEPTLTRR